MPITRAEPTTDQAQDVTGLYHAPGRAFGDGDSADRSSAPDATTDHGPATSRTRVPPELRHERFQIGELLGEGGMGVAAEYRRRGQQLLDELGAVVPEAERLPCDEQET